MIDNDSEASKKKEIVNKMKKYFGEDKVLNVATFSKISSKTAIERACKGMGISGDMAGYLKSLIPVNRGKVAKLKDCLTGENKVTELVKEFKKYNRLQEACLALEGLVSNRGVHAAGTIVCNTPYTDYVSAIRSGDGTLTTCYDLWDAEEVGCIKFDMLTVEAADKIHKTMDYLLEHKKIEWQGSLKDTYYKYLHPDALVYEGEEMWNMIPSIFSVFQFDTAISSKALSATHPQSVMDLSAANSLLRLMPEGSSETPIDRYTRYKANHEEWLKDTKEYGLNDEEREVLWEYLADAYGLADSQEKVMRLSMDKRVSGYSLKEANKLRKSIAKKDVKLQAEAKEQFFGYGRKLGTREVFLDYVWNVVFGASMGYSFSQVHSYAYSTIALQELNLNYFYPRVYWNCACLSVEASNLDEDTKGSTNYGKVAKAIYKMKESNIEVSPPSINDSDIDFTPVEENNTILFGLNGISMINSDITQQIISNRPYSSFEDFYNKNSFEGTLITTSKFVILIKAGCFDSINPRRDEVMKQFVVLNTSQKKQLTMANLPEAVRMGTQIPKDLLRNYKFYKYVCSPRFFYSQHPNFKSKKIYWLDEKGIKFFNKYNQFQLEQGKDWFIEDDKTLIVDKSLEKVFKHTFDAIKQFINTPEFLEDYNKRLYQAEYNRLCPNKDTNHWSFEACSYYANDHELANVDFGKYDILLFDELPEETVFETKTSRGREWKQFELYKIAGTVIDRVDSHHTIVILDANNNVVNCKFTGDAFAFYKQQISVQKKDGTRIVIDPSWFKRGQTIMLTGYRNGENEFRIKTYKSSIFQHKVQKIICVDNETGDIEVQSYRYGYGPDE